MSQPLQRSNCRHVCCSGCWLSLGQFLHLHIPLLPLFSGYWVSDDQQRQAIQNIQSNNFVQETVKNLIQQETRFLSKLKKSHKNLHVPTLSSVFCHCVSDVCDSGLIVSRWTIVSMLIRKSTNRWISEFNNKIDPNDYWRPPKPMDPNNSCR